LGSRKNTAHWRLILDAVRDLDVHPTAEQVFGYVSRRCPTIGKATVYRNLSRMVEAGEILSVNNLVGPARYDRKLDEHCHFVCRVCGRIFDVSGDFDAIRAGAGIPDGFDVEVYNVSFDGICRNCKENPPPV